MMIHDTFIVICPIFRRPQTGQQFSSSCSFSRNAPTQFRNYFNMLEINIPDGEVALRGSDDRKEMTVIGLVCGLARERNGEDMGRPWGAVYW